MSPKEIDELIQRDITDDAWQRQRENPVRFRGKRRAEGMERALYLCPRCRRIGSLKTKDNRIFCDCGLDLEYTETGFFRPETPFSTLADWDDWQQEQLHARAFCRPDAEGPLFTDGGVSLYRVGSGHREEFLGSGGLLLYEDRLVCADRCFPLADTRGMADVLAKRLLFVCGDEYYEIRSGSAGVNLRKYLEVWKEH